MPERPPDVPPLRTRPPTGIVPFPLLLVEGEDKAGKSFALAQLTASDRVGRSFLLDLGDGTLDEYARLGSYELLEHDGTWASIYGQVRAACLEPSDPDRPNVVGIDSGSQVWELLKMWADRRARSSNKNRAILAKDPDAEIDTTMNLWNDAKDRWALLVNTLKAFPGIGVLTASGRDVAVVENGAPTREKVWSSDVEKTTKGRVSATVRLRLPHVARLVEVRSLTVDVPSDGILLPDTGALEHVVFEVLAAGVPFGQSTAVQPTVGIPVPAAKQRLLAAVKAAAKSLTEDEAKAEAGRLWRAAGLPDGAGQEVAPAALARAMPEPMGPPAATTPPPANPDTEPPQPPAAPQPAGPGPDAEPPSNTAGLLADLQQTLDGVPAAPPEGWVDVPCDSCGNPVRMTDAEAAALDPTELLRCPECSSTTPDDDQPERADVGADESPFDAPPAETPTAETADAGEVIPAGTACAMCGSTRSALALVRGVYRCQRANACAQRVQDARGLAEAREAMQAARAASA